MTKRIILLLMMIVTTLSLSAQALAAEPGNGKIEGKLVNATAGGSSVANQEVSLKTFQNNTETGTVTTKTEADGSFVFTGLSTASGYSYQITLIYQEAEYNNEQLSLNAEKTTESITITVYDSTPSDAAVKIALSHTVIYVEADGLRVLEYYRFVNESDRAYIGSKEVPAIGRKETVKFSLPENATELKPEAGLMECCISSNEDDLLDTMPVLPGDREIAYSYKVTYKSKAYTFSRKVNNLTDAYHFLVQGKDTQLSSDQLALSEPADIDGTWFNHLIGSSLTAGNTVVIQVANLPQIKKQGTILWVVALTLVALAGGFGVNRWLKRKQPKPVLAGGNLRQRRQRLLIELAQLDDDFENGKISEESYRRLRTQKKSQLVTLTQRTKENRGNR